MAAFWTRVKHAIFGKPLTHEEAAARHDAQVATARSRASFEHDARSRSVQRQSGWGA